MKHTLVKITLWILTLSLLTGMLTACGDGGTPSSSSSASVVEDKGPIPVVLDTYPGIDDSFAMALAASSDKLDLKAVTAVQGNVPLALTSKNSLALAGYLGLACPVAKGAETPLKKKAATAENYHGASGLGNAKLPDPTASLDARPAWDVIYDCAKENSGRLVIVAVGPLTNIATTIQKHPDIKKMVKKIVIMGGSATAGNATEYAEFNIYNDPDAAKIVFDSGIPMAMMGLDGTNDADYTVSELLDMYTDKSAVYDLFKGITDYLYKSGRSRMTLYDFVAVSWLIDPSVEATYQAEVAVTTDGAQAGKTTVTKKSGGHVTVAETLNKDELTKVLKEMFRHYEK